MQHLRERRSNLYLTTLLVVALAGFSLGIPPASGSSAHTCCGRVGHGPARTTVQCCMPATPESPRSTSPAQGPAVPAPDFTPLPPVFAAPVPAIVTTPVVARPGLLVTAPSIYLLNATLLV
jgi:hypothetical protein